MGIFTDIEKEFVNSTLASAKEAGIDCVLTMKKPGLTSKDEYYFSTDMTTDEIQDVLNKSIVHDHEGSTPVEVFSPMEESNGPTFGDLYNLAINSSTDAKGWIHLFNEENILEDGRWYLRVEPLSRTVQFHRREDMSTRYIACMEYLPMLKEHQGDVLSIRQVWKCFEDKVDYDPHYVSINTSIGYISDDLWNEWLGEYGLLIKDVALAMLALGKGDKRSE